MKLLRVRARVPRKPRQIVSPRLETLPRGIKLGAGHLAWLLGMDQGSTHLDMLLI